MVALNVFELCKLFLCDLLMLMMDNQVAMFRDKIITQSNPSRSSINHNRVQHHGAIVEALEEVNTCSNSNLKNISNNTTSNNNSSTNTVEDKTTTIGPEIAIINRLQTIILRILITA